MSDNKTTLSPPWVTKAREIMALFDGDRGVRCELDDDERVLTLYVDGPMKAHALEKVIPATVGCGSVLPLHVRVVPTNADDYSSLLNMAFLGNPNVTNIVTVERLPKAVETFVVFDHDNAIAQFPNDDLSDYNGVCTKLLQDIAKEILNVPSRVHFSTEVI